MFVHVCGYLIGESVWRRNTRLASAQQVIDQSHAPATHVKKTNKKYCEKLTQVQKNKMSGVVKRDKVGQWVRMLCMRF